MYGKARIIPDISGGEYHLWRGCFGRTRRNWRRWVKTPPEGDGWVHEMKYDGYRIGCRINRTEVTLLSRNGKDWTEPFPEIVEAWTRRLCRAYRAIVGRST